MQTTTSTSTSTNSELASRRSSHTPPKGAGQNGGEFALGHIPALDGLRAFSIILVLFFHDIGPITSHYGHYFNGWIGVDVFFIISGFLITSILVKESKKNSAKLLAEMQAKLEATYSHSAMTTKLSEVNAPATPGIVGNTLVEPRVEQVTRTVPDITHKIENISTPPVGTFSLKNFYMRRWLRIAPAYYAFLGVVVWWHVNGGDHHLKPFLAAALYLTNLDLAFTWNLIPAKLGLSHLWSLAVEEQFYLVWPALLKVVHKHAVKVVLAVVSIVYSWRLYLISQGADWVRIYHCFDTKVDILMYGVLIALALNNERARKLASKIVGNGWAQLFFLISCLQCFHWVGHPSEQAMLLWSVKMPLTVASICGLITSIILAPRAVIALALANPVIAWVGTLSYSLYLWHPLVHSIYCGFYWDYVTKQAARAELIQYGLILVVAAISYYGIERPFLKLKSRFS